MTGLENVKSDLVSFDAAVGQRITEQRELLKVSQISVAAKMHDAGFNWSQATLSKVERGDRPLRFAEALELAKILEMPVEELGPSADMLGRAMRETTETLRREKHTFRTSFWDYCHLLSLHDLLRMLHELSKNRMARYRISASAGSVEGTLKYIARGSDDTLLSDSALVRLANSELADEFCSAPDFGGILEELNAAVEDSVTADEFAKLRQWPDFEYRDIVLPIVIHKAFPNLEFNADVKPATGSVLESVISLAEALSRAEDNRPLLYRNLASTEETELELDTWGSLLRAVIVVERAEDEAS